VTQVHAEIAQVRTFNKLIVLQIGSILEAALSQIIYRAAEP
jgi:hypothetical protein